MDRAHLAHTDTETVIRQALGRSRGSEVEVVGRGGKGAAESVSGGKGLGGESTGSSVLPFIQDHSKVRAD